MWKMIIEANLYPKLHFLNSKTLNHVDDVLRISKTPARFLPPEIPSRSHHDKYSFPLISSSLTKKAEPLKTSHNFYGPFKKNYIVFSVNGSGFATKAQNESVPVDGSEKEEMAARGESSKPERFRYLTKEVPDKPVMWPLLMVLAFALYAWRTVLWELSNWRKVVGAIGELLGYISKLMLAIVFHFTGDPITSIIRLVETAFYNIRSFYCGIVAYAPIPELTLIVTVLAIAETASPDSLNSQPYLLSLAGLIGCCCYKPRL